MLIRKLFSPFGCVIFIGLGLSSCSDDVLLIEMFDGGKQGRSSKLKNGAEATTLHLAPGYRRVLFSLTKPAGFAAAGVDAHGALPIGAVALADRNGSYIPLVDTEEGTIATDLPAGDYWLTTTNQENFQINIAAQPLSSNSGYTTSYQGIEVRSQALFGLSWSKFTGKIYRAAKTAIIGVGIHVGCGLVVDYLKRQENIVCVDLPAAVPDIPVVANCVEALFGCVTILGTGECCQRPGYPRGCGDCGNYR